MNSLWKWFTDRWPFYQIRNLLLEEDIPGGASFAYTIGSAILVVFAFQVVTGILQLFYYVPTTDHAYNSVSYLRTEVPFGWLIHNMHYWGASAMVFLVALHMVRVYIWGAYKKTPLTWFIGIAILLTVMALSFTGAPLIWDQKGYYAGEVGSSIAGEVPIVGGLLEIIMRGGQTMTQLTLSRFFAFHVGVLVPTLALLIGAHIASFRTSGVGGPWDREKQKNTGPFWPDQALRDLIVATTVMLILIALCVYFPVPFAGMADTINTTYVPKPEWNFLFVYQALKYFKGPLEPVGAAGVPAVFVLLLIIVPLIDRNKNRNPFHRPFAMAGLVLYAGLIVTLSVVGYLSPGLAQPAAAKKKEAKKAVSQVSPEVLRGEQIFRKSGCLGCHKVNGKGGSVGPALTAEALKGKSRKWLMDQITHSKSHFPSMGPNTGMTEFTTMGKKDLHDLVSYLMSIEEGKAPKAGKEQTPSGAAGKAPGSKKGEQLFHSQGCIACHKVFGKGGSVGPELSGNTLKGKTRDWIENQIRNPKSHFPNSVMPSFSGLSKEDVSDLASYVLGLVGKSSPGSAAPSPAASPKEKEKPAGSAKTSGAKEGEQLFHSEGCIGCHSVFGKGGSVGPELSGNTLKGKTRQWIEDQIRNPKSHFPNSVMPSFSGLSREDISDLASYVLGLVGRTSPGSAAPSAAASQKEKKKAAKPGKTSGVKEGEQLFHSEGCIGCHSVFGKGGSVGPELSGNTLKGKTRDWIEDQIRNPKSHFPNSVMPSFSGLSREDVNELASYVLSLVGKSSPGSADPPQASNPGTDRKPSGPSRSADPEKTSRTGGQSPAATKDPSGPPPEKKVLTEEVGKAAFIIGSAKNGADLFKEQCVSCHGPKGTDNVPNPGSDDGTVPPLNPIDRALYNPNPKIFVEHIDKIIQHGSMPSGPHPALHMPAWGDSRSLTQQEIANLEAYVLQLNGVDRAKIVSPGLEPETFFFIVLGIFLIAALLAAGAWARRQKR